MISPGPNLTSLDITVFSVCMILFGGAVVILNFCASQLVQRSVKIQNSNELSKRELRIVKKCDFSKEKVLIKINKPVNILMKSGKVFVIFCWILLLLDSINRLLELFFIKNQEIKLLITSDYLYPLFFIAGIVFMKLYLKYISKIAAAYSDLYSRIL